MAGHHRDLGGERRGVAEIRLGIRIRPGGGFVHAVVREDRQDARRTRITRSRIPAPAAATGPRVAAATTRRRPSATASPKPSRESRAMVGIWARPGPGPTTSSGRRRCADRRGSPRRRSRRVVRAMAVRRGGDGPTARPRSTRDRAAGSVPGHRVDSRSRPGDLRAANRRAKGRRGGPGSPSPHGRPEAGAPHAAVDLHQVADAVGAAAELHHGQPGPAARAAGPRRGRTGPDRARRSRAALAPPVGGTSWIRRCWKAAAAGRGP